jgi:hypothetical protein
MPRKQLKVVDSMGEVLESFTPYEAAQELGITLKQLKRLTDDRYYLKVHHVFTPRGSRVRRILKRDIDLYRGEAALFGRISDRIKKALKTCSYVTTGMTQAELARRSKISLPLINRICFKGHRVGIARLRKIADVLGKDITYFLD